MSPQPSDWYHVTREQLVAKGAGDVFLYHPTLADALKKVFPELPRPSRNDRLLRALAHAEEKMGMKDVRAARF